MPPYQWNALDYEKNSTQQQQWANELIDKLGLQGDERLLDVGCGEGKVTAEIASRLPQGSAVGVDVSGEMITLAQQRYPRQDFPNLNFQKADASNLPFSEEFTTVYSNATLHWLLDHRPALQGIARSLRPGGKILLQMGGQGNAIDLRMVTEEQIHSEKWRKYFAGFGFPYGFYHPDEYSEWLRQAGLKPLRVELIPKDMTHQGREGLAGWMRTTWSLPYVQRVPEGEREDFIDELVSAYLSECPVDAQGKTHVKMVRLEVEAAKA